MVDITLKLLEQKDGSTQSSLYSVSSTFTSTDNTVTNPFTYIAPIQILSNSSSVESYSHAESFLDANRNYDYAKDYTKVGANVTIQDSQGKTYPGKMDNYGQFYINGLPVTLSDIKSGFRNSVKYTNL
jgi:hypothetical protein